MPRTIWLVFVIATFHQITQTHGNNGNARVLDEMKGHQIADQSGRMDGRVDLRETYDKLERIKSRSRRSARNRAEDDFQMEIQSRLPKDDSSVREKRSVRGVSKSMRRKRAKQQVRGSAVNYEDMKRLMDSFEDNSQFAAGHEQLRKRGVRYRVVERRKEVPPNMENVDRKRSLFLANLLFMPTEKMPQPLESLFTDSLM